MSKASEHFLLNFAHICPTINNFHNQCDVYAVRNATDLMQVVALAGLIHTSLSSSCTKLVVNRQVASGL